MISGYPVTEFTPITLVECLLANRTVRRKRVLFFANTNFVVKCRSLTERFFNDDVLIVNDGLGMDVACILLYGRKFKSNLNGTDFMPYFFSHAKPQLRVFLIGGTGKALNGAADYIVDTFGHKVVGRCNGYDDIKKTENLIDIINDASADVVLVALGNSWQEEWIMNSYSQVNAKFFVGVGGLFDFWSGDKPRAPKWVQSIRMEWFYRLLLEPKRLYKRYTLDALKFLVSCIKYRNSACKK